MKNHLRACFLMGILLATIVLTNALPANDVIGVEARPGDTIYVIVKKYEYVSRIRLDDAILLSKDTLFIEQPGKISRDKRSLMSLASENKVHLIDYTEKYYVFMTAGGSLIAQGIYNMEHFDGPYREYYSNGKIKMEGLWDHGAKKGTWRYFSPKGKLLNIQSF